MKKLAVSLLAILALSSNAFADGFAFSGRLSNYKTEFDSGVITFETERETSLGLAADFKSGPLVVRGRWDHDLENGLSVDDFLPFENGDYSRDRFEFALGYAPAPFFDLEGGIRIDKIALDIAGFDRDDFFRDSDFDNKAAFLGINAHTASIRPFGWYGTVRAFVGSADIELANGKAEDDTSGFKAETGLIIPLGLSAWEVVPGIEFERIETDRLGLEFNTDRVFIDFVYNFGR